MGTLIRLTNRDPRFYPLLGPFLSRRAVVAEMGSPLWDEDEKTWYVILDDAGAVLGFGATQPAARGTVHFGSAYVVPGARSNGLYQQILAARLADHPAARITVVANAHTAPAYQAAGFQVDRKTKQFWFMHREGTDDARTTG